MVETKRKYVVSLNTSGITNRIKSLLSTLRLSQWLSRNPLIYWPSNADTRCRFSDLYKNPIEVIETEKDMLEIYRNTRWKLCRDVSTSLLQRRCDYLLLRTWRLLVLPGEVMPGFASRVPNATGTDIDFEFHRIPAHVQDGYGALIRSLVPVDYVADQVEKFSSALDDNTVSVSVRSWVESKQRQRLFGVTQYCEIMDSMPEARFFMSCDNPEVVAFFKDKYGKRVVVYPKRTSMGDRNTVPGMQDILIDLYLLSRNSVIVAPAFSTFPEMAWWFGGCKAEVRVVGWSQQYAKEITDRDRRTRRVLLLQNSCYRWWVKLKLACMTRAVQSSESE